MELLRADTIKLRNCELKEVLETQLAGGRSIGYKQSTAYELKSGWPRIRPVNNKEDHQITTPEPKQSVTLSWHR